MIGCKLLAAWATRVAVRAAWVLWAVVIALWATIVRAWRTCRWAWAVAVTWAEGWATRMVRWAWAVEGWLASLWAVAVLAVARHWGWLVVVAHAAV